MTEDYLTMLPTTALNPLLALPAQHHVMLATTPLAPGMPSAAVLVLQPVLKDMMVLMPESYTVPHAAALQQHGVVLLVL